MPRRKQLSDRARAFTEVIQMRSFWRFLSDVLMYIKALLTRHPHFREAISQYDINVKSKFRVLACLGRFPNIEALIPKAAAAARRQFPKSRLTLEPSEDLLPGWAYLVLRIKPEHYTDDFMKKISAVEAEYLADALRSKCNISIAI